MNVWHLLLLLLLLQLQQQVYLKTHRNLDG